MLRKNMVKIHFYLQHYKKLKFSLVNMLIALTRKRSYRDYWSAKLETRDPYISSAVSVIGLLECSETFT